MVQDGPPPGGFPSVRYARRLPSTGPAGPTLFLVSGAVMAYGFYLVRSRGLVLVSTLTLYPAIEVQPWRQNAVTSLVVTAHLNFYITPAAALCSQPVDWRSALQCLPDRLAACLVATSHSNPTLAANRLAPPLPQVGQTNIEKRVLKAEKTAARRALVPVLQAEEDRRCAFDISHCGKSFIYCNPKT